MHELVMTQQILELAMSQAAQVGNGRVTDLYLVNGELSSYTDDSIQFYWDIISQGTSCAGARLHFAHVPARLECRECGSNFGLDDGLVPLCPSCGHSRANILAGQEFRLDSLELADAPVFISHNP
jgi:hydrogenase nickel incorporation protein HypA/HybF